MTADPVRPEPPTVCFAVRASADPGTLPRLIEPFAKRGLVLSSIHTRLSGDFVVADLQVRIEPSVAGIIAEGLRQLVMVDRVLVSELQAALPRALP